MPFYHRNKRTTVNVGDELIYDSNELIVYIVREGEILERADKIGDLLKPKHFNVEGPGAAEALVKAICCLRNLWFTQPPSTDDKMVYRFTKA